MSLQKGTNTDILFFFFFEGLLFTLYFTPAALTTAAFQRHTFPKEEPLLVLPQEWEVCGMPTMMVTVHPLARLATQSFSKAPTPPRSPPALSPARQQGAFCPWLYRIVSWGVAPERPKSNSQLLLLQQDSPRMCYLNGIWCLSNLMEQENSLGGGRGGGSVLKHRCLALPPESLLG